MILGPWFHLGDQDRFYRRESIVQSADDHDVTLICIIEGDRKWRTMTGHPLSRKTQGLAMTSKKDLAAVVDGELRRKGHLLIDSDIEWEKARLLS